MRTPLATMLLLSSASLVACITFSALGQQVPPEPPPAAAPATEPATQPATQPVAEANTPALPPAAAVLTDEQGKPVSGVRLTRADLRAVVRGPLAQVTVTLTFANDEDRVLGGELVFPLPEGATVSGYGLEVNGSMVDGVIVDKQQARDIYNIESTRRVDPGLVEHVAGNAFRTRLYPVPANGSRSARVQYVTEIAATRVGATLSLPLGWGKVDKWTVGIEAPEAAIEPAVELGGGGLAFYGSAHGFLAEGTRKEAPREFVVRFARPPGRSVAVERWPLDPASTVAQGQANGHADDGDDGVKGLEQFEDYFLLNDTPPAPPAGPAPEVAAELRSRAVRRAAILWDAGLSRSASDKRRELELLDSLLSAWPGATGELVVFRDTAEVPVSFDLGVPGGQAKVIEQLRRLTYDGASDLSDLPLPKNAAGFVTPTGTAQFSKPANRADRPTADYDCLLLFTDGMGGTGRRVMPKPQVPVYAFSDDARENAPLLEHVCRESGGRYYNLRNCSGDGTREPWSLLSVSFDPDEVAEVYPPGPIPVEKVGCLTLAGRLLTPSAAITLNYGYGDRIIDRERSTLKAADAGAGDLVPRYWAQQKVAKLSIEPEANDRELTRIGKRFNLVTPNTSFLVLETASQYVRYQVVPPKSQPRLYGEFLALTHEDSAQRATAQNTQEQKLQQVLGAWNLQVQWWKDPEALERPAPELAWKGPEQRATEVRRSRELTRDAMHARRAGDFAAARDLYARAVVLDPGNAEAVQRLREFDEGWAGLNGKALARMRRADQAETRADDSASAFQAALDRSRLDVAQHDLLAADQEIDQAREALGGNASAHGPGERTQLDARLADAKHLVDAARLAAARDARATREKMNADAYAQRATDQRREGVNKGGGVNTGGGYHRSDYGWGSGGGLFGGGGGGGGGASASLFGGSGGGSGPNPPSAPSTGSTGSPQPGSTSSPQAGSGQAPSTGSEQASTPAPDQPTATSIDSDIFLGSTIIRPWAPAMPYLAAMKRVPRNKAYDAYLEQRRVYGASPPFYLDCADYLERIGQHALAVRMVSDVSAFPLADVNLLRRAACRFAELGERDRAIDLFERVLELRPAQPQSYRDLALALSDRADALADLPRADTRRDDDRIAADYARCLDLLNHVIVQGDQLGEATNGFTLTDLTCLMDANRVIARVKRLRLEGGIPRVLVPLEPRLIQNLDCDLRVVVSVDTDQTRASLTVTEPDDDKAVASYASYHQTRIGGRVDSVVGTGAEEYCLRTLLPGRYWLGFGLVPSVAGRRGPDPDGPCTLRLTIFTDFGRANEKRKTLSLRVKDPGILLDGIGITMSRGAAPRLQNPDNVQVVETLP